MNKPAAEPELIELELMAEKLYKWMQVTRYSDNTVVKVRQRLRRFFTWCKERGLETLEAISRAVIERYQRYLFHYRQPRNGQPLTSRTQFGYLTAIKRYFSFLAKKHFIIYNPASELDMPRIERSLPRDILNVSEVEQVMIQPDLSNPIGLRDRTILELFYSSGIRRMEVVNIAIYDVNFDRGVLMIREGKGKKDRVVPVGQRAMDWIEKYLYEGRPRLLCAAAEDNVLFLSARGTSINPDHLTALIRKYVEKSGISKKGACHIFRHTMATLMLDNGADIRHLQEMLGHADIKTTQIYTHVSIPQLKKVHDMTHPANQGAPGGSKDSPLETPESLDQKPENRGAPEGGKTMPENSPKALDQKPENPPDSKPDNST